MTDVPRVVVVHDDRLVHEIVMFACEARGIPVVAQIHAYDELLENAVELRPDVVIVADRLGDVLVEDALENLSQSGARLLVLSCDPSADRLGHVLVHDVAGYLSYDAGPDEIACAVLAVARGEAVLMPEVLNLVLSQWRRLRTQPISLGARRRPALTPRELDILAAMTEGLATKAIAARLGVAIKTVENHKIRIFEKLGVRNHAHAVTVALAYGLAGATDACP